MIDIAEVRQIIASQNFVKTSHRQLGGEYEGETLTKLYAAGRPSYLAILRENGDLISLKRDALVIYQA